MSQFQKLKRKLIVGGWTRITHLLLKYFQLTDENDAVQITADGNTIPAMLFNNHSATVVLLEFMLEKMQKMPVKIEPSGTHIFY